MSPVGTGARRFRRSLGAVAMAAGVFVGGIAVAQSSSASTGSVEHTTVVNTGGTKAIDAKALTDHECNSSEWHFVITQVSAEAQAPAAIKVTFKNSQTATVALGKFTGKTAHYTTTKSLDSLVTSASAKIYEGWTGQFNLSHGPCGDVPPGHPTKVAPKPPVAHDECGTRNDTVTIPDVEGVYYTLNGKVAKPGTYPAHGTVVVKAHAKKGFVLEKGKKSAWEFCFTDKPCKPEHPTKVTPLAPTSHDECGIRGDTYTIPDITGVEYFVNDAVVEPGTYPVADRKLFVKAKAKPGYKLHGKSVWVLYFTDKACPPKPPTTATPATPTTVDKCGVDHDTVTIPATEGVSYTYLGKVVKAGTYSVGQSSLTLKAVAWKGYVLKGVSEWTLKFTNQACPKPPTTTPAPTKPPVKPVPSHPVTSDVPVDNTDDRGFVADTGADNDGNGPSSWTLALYSLGVLLLLGGGAAAMGPRGHRATGKSKA